MMGSVFLPPRAARACGGGVVTRVQSGTIGANAQRIVISVHGGTTDVITQIGVPATTADYGVLIPVPSAPTLDPSPVASADIDVLDTKTAPTFIQQPNNEGGIPLPSCGCGSSDKGGVGQPFDAGVHVSQPVTIGPVTAVSLTADTGDAINAWLADNGFVVPTGDQSLVDAYAGTGRYFIAIRRSDTAATGGATSVGVHFTLAGDERGLPLRFARLGAATTVAFTVFVAADAVVAPSSPFAALTINDLSGNEVNTKGYASTLSTAVSQRGNHAFVLEGAWTVSSLSNAVGASLSSFVQPSQTLTRLSTIVPATALDTDVVFDQPYSGTVPNQRYTQRTRTPGGKTHMAFGAALLAFAAVARRRPRRS